MIPSSIASFARYGGASEVAVAARSATSDRIVRPRYGFVSADEHADSPRGSRPAPVVDRDAALLGQVAAGLVHLHEAVASSASRATSSSTRPCS